MACRIYEGKEYNYAGERVIILEHQKPYKRIGHPGLVIAKVVGPEDLTVGSIRHIIEKMFRNNAQPVKKQIAKNKKKSNAKATLVKLQELLDQGVDVCFDAIQNINAGVYQITCYPKGKSHQMEHAHFEGESFDDVLTQAHDKFVNNDD